MNPETPNSSEWEKEKFLHLSNTTEPQISPTNTQKEADTTSPQKEEQKPGFLATILAQPDKVTSWPVWQKIEQESTSATNQIGNTIPKKKIDPITPAVFFKYISALLLVSFIFFWSFLAYIVFNPEQTQFFVRFGIDPDEIKVLLRKLVDIVFGIMTLIFSIIWIIYLFRSFLTPKEYQKRKTLAIMLAIFFGIILFGNITAWAKLVQQIKVIDPENPFWNVLIYDNELYKSETGKDNAKIRKTSELIGPITLFFDISTNAQRVEEKETMTIGSFQINFNGAKCVNGKDEITGTDPKDNKTLICTFDEVKTYNITGKYTWIHKVSREKKEVNITLPWIDIKWLIEKKEGKNLKWEKTIILDATKLQKTIWNPLWIEPDGTENKKTSLIRVANGQEQLICLRIIQTNGCDRIFLISDTNTEKVHWEITATQNPVNALVYEFELKDTDINVDEIQWYKWITNEWNIICEWNTTGKCEYALPKYGKYSITLEIILANNEIIRIKKDGNVQAPVKLMRPLRIMGPDKTNLAIDNNFDDTLKAFVLKWVPTPTELILDAQDVVPNNQWLTLQSVEWEIMEIWQPVKKKIGIKITADILTNMRHEIIGKYTFKNRESWTLEYAQERIIVESNQTEIIPELYIEKESDYAPTIVRADASASTTKEWNIKKFIFDFWEGRPPVEGDSIQEYQYLKDGEKTITLTIIREDGVKAVLQKNIVLKSKQKTIVLNASIWIWFANKAVDFDANGTEWQIDTYIWNFWDNTQASYDPAPSHVYKEPGQYNVQLSVTYDDGTIKTASKTITIEATSEDE